LLIVRSEAEDAPVQRLTFAGPVMSLAMSPDGQRLAVGSGRDAAVITLLTWPGLAKQTELSGHTHFVQALAFSPDGSRLASGSMDHTIRLWSPDLAMEMATLYGNDYGVFSLAFMPDGATLLSGAADGRVRSWKGR
jgi:WD40 repeat protein